MMCEMKYCCGHPLGTGSHPSSQVPLRSAGSVAHYMGLTPMDYKPQEGRDHICLTHHPVCSTKHSSWYILFLNKISERMDVWVAHNMWLNREGWSPRECQLTSIFRCKSALSCTCLTLTCTAPEDVFLSLEVWFECIQTPPILQLQGGFSAE